MLTVRIADKKDMSHTNEGEDNVIFTKTYSEKNLP